MAHDGVTPVLRLAGSGGRLMQKEQSPPPTAGWKKFKIKKKPPRTQIFKHL